jgi:hypothetical protein
MARRVLKIDYLPEDSVKAAAVFYGEHLGEIEDLLSPKDAVLAICLPAASKAHDHWRRAAARDLARSHAPKRVNIVGGTDGVEIETILTYLDNAPGITGQYFAAHE